MRSSLWTPNVMLPTPTVFWTFTIAFLFFNLGAPSKWFAIQLREVVGHAFLQSGDKEDNTPTGKCKWYLLKEGQGGSFLFMLMADKWGLWRLGGRSEFHGQSGEEGKHRRATFPYAQVSDNNVIPWCGQGFTVSLSSDLLSYMNLTTTYNMGCFILDKQKRELRINSIKWLSKVTELQVKSGRPRKLVFQVMSRLHMPPFSRKPCGPSSRSPCRGPLPSPPSTCLYIFAHFSSEVHFLAKLAEKLSL